MSKETTRIEGLLQCPPVQGMWPGACCILVAWAALPGLLAAQAPRIDHHQHLFSAGAAALVTGNAASPGINAYEVVALLDAAGVERALVLSMAYTWGRAGRVLAEDEYTQVRAENDWTAEQVARYPARLRAFCSVNPLKTYALHELARCSRHPHLRHGLKLHFGSADVDYASAEALARVREVFAAANRYGMAIVVHMRASVDLQRPYGAAQARVFLDELLPAAPDVMVQIAHLAGSGGYDAATDSALTVFIEALGANDPRMRNVWFDVTAVVRPLMATDRLQQIAERIQQLGMDRVLYGSDAAASPLSTPQAGWRTFQRLPLTEEEFRVIAGNIAPYLREWHASPQ